MNFRRILLRRKKRRSKNIIFKSGKTKIAPLLALREARERDRQQSSTSIDSLNALLQHLYIAHDLAVHEDVNIKLHKYRNNDKVTTIRGAIKYLYWNLFKEQVNDDPPKLELAFELLSDIKKTLDFLVRPNGAITSLQMDNINRMLDEECKRYQASNDYDVTDLMNYTKYTIGMISKLHLSIKERFFKKLSKETDIVLLFRGIAHLLTNMKSDLLKLSSDNNAQEITNNYLEYEKEKFSDYMQAVGESLPITSQWLTKYIDKDSTARQIVHEAIIDLLTWSTSEPYPETLFIDADRLNKLKLMYFRSVVSCTSYFLSIGLVPLKSRRNSMIKESIRNQIVTIMSEAYTDEDVKDLAKTLAEEIQSKIFTYTNKKKPIIEFNAFVETLEKASNRDYKIRSMVTEQLNDYLKKSLLVKASIDTHFPNALNLFKKEIHALKLQFLRIFGHNLLICMPHYETLISSNKDNKAIK